MIFSQNKRKAVWMISGFLFFANIISAIFFFSILSTLLFAQNQFPIKFGDSTYTLKKYFFCLLKTRPNKDIDSLKPEEIRNGFLTNIFKLCKEGKTAIADLLKETVIYVELLFSM